MPPPAPRRTPTVAPAPQARVHGNTRLALHHPNNVKAPVRGCATAPGPDSSCFQAGLCHGAVLVQCMYPDIACSTALAHPQAETFAFFPQINVRVYLAMRPTQRGTSHNETVRPVPTWAGDVYDNTIPGLVGGSSSCILSGLANSQLASMSCTPLLSALRPMLWVLGSPLLVSSLAPSV